MTIPPKLPKSLTRSAVHEIGLAIVRGEFAPGAVLPTEEALAARVGASRPALREAIKVLSGKGLIRTARRYGSRVCPQAEWHFLDPDVLAWHLSEPARWPQFLRDIVEVRLMLEPTAAIMAAERATEEEIARILALAEALPVVTGTHTVETDIAFHTAVMRASHNGIIAGFAPAMEILLRAYFAAVHRLRPHRPKFVATTNLHQSMAAAIAARDPATARTALAEMLEITRREIDDVLSMFETPPSDTPAFRLRVDAASAMFRMEARLPQT